MLKEPRSGKIQFLTDIQKQAVANAAACFCIEKV